MQSPHPPPKKKKERKIKGKKKDKNPRCLLLPGQQFLAPNNNTFLIWIFLASILCNSQSFQNTCDCSVQEVLQIKGSFTVQEHGRETSSFPVWWDAHTHRKLHRHPDEGFTVLGRPAVGVAGRSTTNPPRSFVIPRAYHSLQRINTLISEGRAALPRSLVWSWRREATPLRPGTSISWARALGTQPPPSRTNKPGGFVLWPLFWFTLSHVNCEDLKLRGNR